MSTDLHEGWNHVARYHWLHHSGGLLRLRWQRVGDLCSYIIGQGDRGAEAEQFTADRYCGPLLEFRFNADSWAYSLTYPGRPDAIPALVADVGPLGLHVYRPTGNELRADMRALERWAVKTGYRVVDGLWVEP